MKQALLRLLIICFSFYSQACASRPPIPEETRISTSLLEKNADQFVLALYEQKLEKVLSLSDQPFYLNHQGILRKEEDWLFTLKNMYQNAKPTQVNILGRQILTPQIMYSQHPEAYALLIETGFDKSYFVFTELQSIGASKQNKEKVILIVNPKTGKIQGFFLI